MDITKALIQKLGRGDAITDAELPVLLSWFDDLDRKLRLMGPEFWLARIQTSRIVDLLNSYKHARGMR